MLNDKKNIYYTLRFASAMCFLGHGAFGIITKPIWCNYFGVFGIGHEMSYKLMPMVGTMDILMGISLLIYPTAMVFRWLVIWGTMTALCRPLSGEPFAEFIERAGNYGVPLALLILCSSDLKGKTWLTFIKPEFSIDQKTLSRVILCLKIVVFMVLLGHGWLNLIEKNALISQYSSLGFSNPVNVAHLVGIFEIFAACMVLIKPVRPVLLAFLIWKMGSELFYPHWELFEWIERGGSYGAILALWFALPRTVAPIVSKSIGSLIKSKNSNTYNTHNN
jgi:hypothetical protein